MAQTEKLRRKLLGLPAEMRIEEVQQVLEDAGWTMDRVVGSHHQFTKPGMRTFPITAHNGKVKRGYLRQIAEHLTGDREE